VLPGIIGSLQAMEAIKLLANLGHPPLGRLIHYRALPTLFREIKIKPDPGLPTLRGQPYILLNPSLTKKK
jgi:adenylyltransferase/sulfurtransferase